MGYLSLNTKQLKFSCLCIYLIVLFLEQYKTHTRDYRLCNRFFESYFL